MASIEECRQIMRNYAANHQQMADAMTGAAEMAAAAREVFTTEPTERGPLFEEWRAVKRESIIAERMHRDLQRTHSRIAALFSAMADFDEHNPHHVGG